MNPPPDPSWELQQYKQALQTLLHTAEAEADAVADRFDQIIGKLERLVALLADHQAALDNALGRRARGTIHNLAKTILRAARNGHHRAIRASSATERASETLNEPPISVASGGRFGPDAAAGPVLQTVVAIQAAGNGTGKVSRREFFVDGIRHTFSATQGALFAALCADDGESDDRFVAFKSKQALERQLGVSTSLLHMQVHRLRDRLEKTYGFARNLLETDSARGYRIRVVQKAPDPGRASL